MFEITEEKWSISFVDFSFICRICLKRGDLRLFEEEGYLLDLFMTITKIDVRSTVSFPRNICNECINKLQDISLFIDISNNKHSRPLKNLIPKNENEYAPVDCWTSQESLVKTEKTTEHYEEDINDEKSGTCQICSSLSCITPFREKAHLMQLFHNITSIDVEADSNVSSWNGICNKCINELESTSLFISLSVCNDMKLASTIRRNEALKTETCLDEIDVDICFSKCRTEVKMESYPNENAGSYESKDFYELVDIKEEILDVHEVPIKQNYGETNSVENPSEGDPYENKASTELTMFSQQLESSSEVHSNFEQFKCDCCERSFTRKHSLDRHLLTGTGRKQFKCDCCQKKFAQASSLKRHMLTHTGEKPFECDCCGRSFSLKTQLRQHMLTHTGEKPFKCDCCDGGFNQKILLQRHVLTHTGEKPFGCDCCDKSFSRSANLRQHMLSHTGEKAYNCDICKKSFAYKGYWKRHALTHTGEKPYKCDNCEKRFTGKHNLKMHSLTHAEDKTFKCDCCEKSFAQKNDLKLHVLTHTGVKTFKCDICDKGFIHRSNLSRHAHTHSGKKSFKYDCCEKSFFFLTILQQHVLTHTGEKPFKCDRCEKRFTQRSHLRRHMLIHTR